MQERIGNFLPGAGIRPRRPELVLVVADVLIGTVTGYDVRNRCTTHRGLEARRAGDEIIGRHPTVTPTTDSEPFRICQTAPDRVVDRREIVLHVDAAPRRINAHRVGGTTTGRAARIRQDYKVAIGREDLLLEI